MRNAITFPNRDISEGGGICYRLIAGTEDHGVQEDFSCFWYCTFKRAVMSSTNRQELREYTFSTRSQIGLEVEAIDDKVMM